MSSGYRSQEEEFGLPDDEDRTGPVTDWGRVTTYEPETRSYRPKWEVHDSGSKSQYDDGMQRDSTDGKPQPALMFPRGVPYGEQLLTRVAMQYHLGGRKYGDRNWEKSATEESLAHHEDALLRHVFKYVTGTDDGEDHAAAIVWNVNAIDLTRRNIRKNQVHSFATADKPTWTPDMGVEKR